MERASSSSARRSTAREMASLTVFMRALRVMRRFGRRRRPETLPPTRWVVEGLQTARVGAQRFASRFRLADGQIDGEERATAGTVLGPDAAAVLRHDAVGDGEAEPAPIAGLLGGEEGIEDPRQMLGGNPWPIVCHLDAHARVDHGRADGEYAARVGLHHGVLGILD